MNYHLRIYDNYHHGNESEAYDHGSYVTYEEAEQAAKAIVVQFLENKWERGETARTLTAKYALTGIDIIILPANNRSAKRFSARDYVNEMAESICLKLHLMK